METTYLDLLKNTRHIVNESNINLGLSKKVSNSKKDDSRLSDKVKADLLPHDSWVVIYQPAFSNYSYKENNVFWDRFEDRRFQIYSSGGTYHQMFLLKTSEIPELCKIYNWKKPPVVYEAPEEIPINTDDKDIKKFLEDHCDNWDFGKLIRKKIKLDESYNLGLSKKITDKGQSTTVKDKIDGISMIKFKDPEIERICHELGVYTYEDASQLQRFSEGNTLDGEIFSMNDDLMYFPEFQYFTCITEVPNHFFDSDRFIGDIILPSSGNLKVLGEYAFYNCWELDKIVIPEGVEEIRRCCFKNCRELKSIKIPSTLRYIAANSFDGCKNLIEIIIPTKAKANDYFNIGSLKLAVSFGFTHNTVKIVWVDDNNQIVESSSSNLGLAKKISDKSNEVSAQDKIEDLISITEEDIINLYEKWGHVLMDYQDKYGGPDMQFPRQAGPNGKKLKSVENVIRESYSKFITDMTDGDMFFNHHLQWGQEGLIALEFYDYRNIQNRRSLRNLIYLNIYGEDQRRASFSAYHTDFIKKNKNLIREWYIPETVKCLKKNPDFIHYFLSKLK